MRRAALIAAFALALLVRVFAAPGVLTLYFIDVEGGQSTLIVSPSGQSLLIDAGYRSGGRDATRIRAAMRDAGVSQIDHLLLTHFHMDHMGGVPELAAQVPIKRFYDHDTLVDRSDPPTVAGFADYQRLRNKGTHVVPVLGSALPISGLDVQWVSSDGRVISSAREGAGETTNGCPPVSPPPGEPLENPRSTGFFLRYGTFRFVDLGDLSGAPLYKLVCPSALLGPVDLLLVPHHGGNDTGYPAVLNAFKPRAALINNGAVKGGGAATFQTLQQILGLTNVWQLHRSENAGVVNAADANIANLDEATGNWLKATASEDGSFTLTNQRTQQSRSYPAGSH